VKRIEAERRFGVTVDRGFAFITDTANWPAFWPGFVRLEEGSRWEAAGDTARITTRLLGRERLLTMRITTFEPKRLVTYTSTQPGLPDAAHQRHYDLSTGSSSSTSRGTGSPVSSIASCLLAESAARSARRSERWRTCCRLPEADSRYYAVGRRISTLPSLLRIS
jgi:hypothetical protein